MSITFENEVAIYIDQERYRLWDSIKISRAIDRVDTVQLGAPFDPNEAVFADTFQPFSFKSFVVSVNGLTFFTGAMIPVNPALSASSNTVSVGAYSRPGVLGDCTLSGSDMQTLYRKQTLHEIADQIVRPFGLTTEFKVEAGQKFDKVKRDPATNVLSFLADLAKQRNQVIANNQYGAVLFQRAITSGQPVAEITEGSSPGVSITPKFDPSKYYSEITGIRPIRPRARKTVQYTVKNPLIPSGIFRPHVFKTTDAKDGDLEQAVRGKMGRMFADMVSYSVTVPTWRTPIGRLWAPNTIVRLHFPGVMIYKPFDFVIRSVDFTRAANSETATLNVMLPGSFSPQLPQGVPWVR